MAGPAFLSPSTLASMVEAAWMRWAGGGIGVDGRSRRIEVLADIEDKRAKLDRDVRRWCMRGETLDAALSEERGLR